VDFKQTNNWLKGTGLKAETEGLIIAAQDQSLSTRLYHYKIIKDRTSRLCQLCNQYDESIDHILSGSPELAKTTSSEKFYRSNKDYKVLPIGAPEPGLDAALMVNVTEESRRIRDNNSFPLGLI